MDHGSIAVRAVQTTLTYVCILLIGAALAVLPRGDPMINVQTRQKLGKLTMSVFMPALIGVSLAANLSWSLMTDGAWVLPVWACIHMLINLSCGFAVRSCLRIPAWFRLEFLLAFTSTNGLGLPLIILEPLCRSTPIDSIRYGPDADILPFERATSYLFIYNLPWIVYLLGGCHFFLSTRVNTSEAASNEGAGPSTSFLVEGLMNPAMLATYIGLTIGRSLACLPNGTLIRSLDRVDQAAAVSLL